MQDILPTKYSLLRNSACHQNQRKHILDQGSQFTSTAFTDVLREHCIKISMDGKGRCLDNAKMERFWWSLKYENIYLNDYVSLPQMRLGIQSYINFYNSRRIHSALGWKTPNMAYGQACNLKLK